MTGRWAPVVLVSSLLLAILAQWVLCCHQEIEWLGLVCYGVAVVLFVGSVGSAVPRRRRLILERHEDGPAWTLLFVTIAASLVVCAAYLAHATPLPSRNYEYAALLWLAGVGLAVVALLGRRARRRGARGRWKEALTVGLFVAVALVLRLAGLAQFPDLMSGDEGSMALEAQRIMRGDLLNPFGTGWLSHPNLFFYLQAAALKLLGWNLFGLRFSAAVLGALSVAAVYLLARGTFGREVAWVSALFLAGWSLPLHLSRLALNNSPDPLFGALVLTFLQRGLVRGRRVNFIAAGLALGTSLYFYHGTRLLIPLVLVTLVLSGRERLRRRWRGLFSFAIVALLVSGPLLAHFIQHPDVFLARSAVTGLFQSDELAVEQQATGKSLPWLMLEHLGRAAFAFIQTRDVGYFYTPAIPMLYVFSGALFILGVGLALSRWWEMRYQVLLAWIGLAVLFGGWLLKSPPHYQRYLIAAPAVCLLVGQAAVVALRRVARLWGWRLAMRRGLVMLLTVMLLTVNAGYYFGVYAPSGAFSDRNTEIADRAARLMADLGPDYTTYFFGLSNMRLSGFNSVRFLAPGADWMDVEESPVVDWSFVQEGRGAQFVILPQREGELELLCERFPTGEQWPFIGRDGQTLFIVYRVEPADVQRPAAGGEP
ncbi:MAG: ArnT family glycosyltransferase [Anaerolineae bacterium]